MSDWTFRLAEPADAEAFSKWVSENPFIDSADVQEGLKKNQPTVITFVVCYRGTPVWFAPVYATMHLAHLGVNPEIDAELRKTGLEKLMDYVGAFAYQMGVRYITTLTKERYPIGRWAKQHGFTVDPRQLFKFNLHEWVNKEK